MWFTQPEQTTQECIEKTTQDPSGFYAGVERIELPSAVLETDVLPLYDTTKKKMVTRTGFEPVNAAVKGRCVKPLHQRAISLLILAQRFTENNTEK